MTPLRRFVAASRLNRAVFSVAEAFVGAVGGLGVGAPEVAVSGGVFFRGKAGVDELAFGQEVSATFALHNFEFVLHGFILELEGLLIFGFVSGVLRRHAREGGHPVKFLISSQCLLGSRLRGNDGNTSGMTEILLKRRKC